MVIIWPAEITLLLMTQKEEFSKALEILEEIEEEEKAEEEKTSEK